MRKTSIPESMLCLLSIYFSTPVSSIGGEEAVTPSVLFTDSYIHKWNYSSNFWREASFYVLNCSFDDSLSGKWSSAFNSSSLNLISMTNLKPLVVSDLRWLAYLPESEDLFLLIYRSISWMIPYNVRMVLFFYSVETKLGKNRFSSSSSGTITFFV